MREVVGRDSIFDRERGQVGIIRKLQILIIGHSRASSVRPRIPTRSIRISELIHDDGDVGITRRNRDGHRHRHRVLGTGTGRNVIGKPGIKNEIRRPDIIIRRVGAAIDSHFIRHGVKVIRDRHLNARNRNSEIIGIGSPATGGRGGNYVGVNKHAARAVGIPGATIFHQQRPLTSGADEREGQVRNARRGDHQPDVHGGNQIGGRHKNPRIHRHRIIQQALDTIGGGVVIYIVDGGGDAQRIR